jgi:hypothetical protein
MADQPQGRSKTRSVTVVALLGIFVGAVVLLLAGKMLPGRFSAVTRGMAKTARRGRR